MNGPQPSSLQDADWKVLLERINKGKCTPFLGGEASMGSIPRSSTIARELAAESGYPMEDSDSLPRVAQFIATTADPIPTARDDRCTLRGGRRGLISTPGMNRTGCWLSCRCRSTSRRTTTAT